MSLIANAQKDRKAVEDHLMDFVSQQMRDGKSPSYVENYVKAVRTWLEFNDVKLVRRIKIGGTTRTSTIDDERVPTRDELRQILGYADERDKATIGLMAFSGLRPQVLGDDDGSDGLELRDLPEMQVKDGEVSFVKVPTIVVVKAGLSKARHEYMTFLGEEGGGYLKAYLEKRLTASLDHGSQG
jgi:hypothetical protein